MTATTDALADFLLARIAEDEAEVPERYRTDDYGTGFNMDQVAVEVACPRWLAECEAKRQIVEEVPSLRVLAALALPYAGHPDYRDEWRP